MNDEELYANFYKACLKYAEDNGGVPKERMTNICTTTIIDSPPRPTIVDWLHDSTEPTDTQLKAYTANQVSQLYDCKKDEVNLEKLLPLRLSQDRIDMLVDITNGSLVYNTTTNKLQVYADSIWTNLH